MKRRSRKPKWKPLTEITDYDVRERQAAKFKDGSSGVCVGDFA
jgi:hypothetical protein